jgi:hypothetical protein
VSPLSLLSALALVLAARSAAADPGDDEPEPAALEAAPRADQASGIAVQSPDGNHWFANGVLALPRTLALILLAGPRYAASELDDYLEGRSPDAFGRTVKHTWRTGVVADWETSLGPSLGLRLGRGFARATAVDVHGGLFGARGQSGGLRATLGTYTDIDLEPSVTFDAGRQLARVYAGIDARGPRTHYLERRFEARGALASRLGLLRVTATAGVAQVSTYDEDTDDDPVAASYDPMTITGFAERQRAATGELAVTYDNRRRSYNFIHAGAWSTGWLLRAATAYSRGDGSRTGMFSLVRGTLEARRLFDLFHGDRVLSIGARTEMITADADEVPFEALPALGGADRLRAFARDELRGRSATYADIQYEWALGADTRAFVFVEAGGVARRPTVLERRDIHVGYGGGLRLLNGMSTSLRAHLAASDDGDLGFFLQLGAL